MIITHLQDHLTVSAGDLITSVEITFTFLWTITDKYRAFTAIISLSGLMMRDIIWTQDSNQFCKRVLPFA